MNTSFKIIAAMAVAAFGMGFGLGTPASAQTVTIEQGTVSGTRTGDADAFLGIPYAATTGGANRWQAPQPAPQWTGVRETTAFGPSCQQQLSEPFGPYTAEYLVQGDVSEDCLSLNVWRPASAATQDHALPVMVWIHGGGFTSGSASVPIYDGAALASHDVIVVSVNYRLGVFGFLAHPDLTREGRGSGNFGLLDIMAALTWVQSNIAAFGGDPAQVTIAGQSAGSMVVHDLIAAPAARNLFIRAISESGPGMGHPPEPIATAEERGKQLLVTVGARSIDELRRMPAEQVVRAAQALGTGLLQFAPVIDGKLLPADPYASRRGAFTDTPILGGMNADEAFILPQTDIAGFRQEVEDYFGPMSDQAWAVYGTSDPAAVEEADRLMRRERGMASTLAWASRRAAESDRPIYLYRFNHVEPGSEEWGAFHTSEVPYAFQTLGKACDRSFTETDDMISDLMASYWTNFVKAGDPNGPGLPRWPTFNVAEPEMLDIKVDPEPIEILTLQKRALYDQVRQAGKGLTLF